MDRHLFFALFKNIFLQPRKFFLENLGLKQTILKNTFWLVLAEAITRFLKLFLFIYIARILGASEYGKFAFALAFIGLFSIFSDLGISSIVIRELSRGKEKEKEFPAILSLKILLSLAALILILTGSFLITPDPLIQKLIWVLAIFVMVESFGTIIFAFFQARQKMEYQAWTKILEAVIVTGAGFYVLFYFPSVLNLSLAYLFSALATLIFILAFFWIKNFPLKLTFQKSIWKNYLKLSWPLALASFFATIYTNTDSAMMGYFGQIPQTGWYNAAQRVIGVSLIPAGLISISFFPVLGQFFAEREKLQRAWDYYLETMIFLAIPILVGGMILAPKVIDLVYDPSYFPSILAFQILLVMAAISMISIPFGQILVVFNQQKRLFWLTLAGAILNFILNLILIPKYSLYGAAITTTITVFLVTLLAFQFTQRFTSIQPFNFKLFLSLFGALFSSILMSTFILQPKIYQLHTLIIISLAAFIYTTSFLIYKLILNKVSKFTKII